MRIKWTILNELDMGPKPMAYLGIVDDTLAVLVEHWIGHGDAFFFDPSEVTDVENVTSSRNLMRYNAEEDCIEYHPSLITRVELPGVPDKPWRSCRAWIKRRVGMYAKMLLDWKRRTT